MHSPCQQMSTVALASPCADVNITSHSSLQNGKLLAERDGVKRRTEELAMEKDALKVLPSLAP